jgi:hypothetical protein
MNVHRSAILTLTLTLFVTLFAPFSITHAQSTSFATTCETNANNHTLFIRSALDPGFGNGQQVQPGDTLAVYTESGVCAGYEVWTGGSSDLVISAAEDVSLTDPVEGYVPGEPLKFKVFDVSEDQVVDLGTNISFEPCNTVDFPLCIDDGTYERGQASFIDGLNDGPLPVEFTAFDGTARGSQVVLEWTTATEQNNAGFDVQHRSPDAPNWTSLSFVDGAGTTSHPQTYRFETDDLAFGTHTFRLKQVDQDGSSSLSDEVTVALTLDRAFVLSDVYPNPVRSAARIDLTVRENQPVTVELYDLLGRQVETVYDRPLEANRTRSIRIPTGGLSSGAYFLRVRGQSFAETRRITVLR